MVKHWWSFLSGSFMPIFPLRFAPLLEVQPLPSESSSLAAQSCFTEVFKGRRKSDHVQKQSWDFFTGWWLVPQCEFWSFSCETIKTLPRIIIPPLEVGASLKIYDGERPSPSGCAVSPVHPTRSPLLSLHGPFILLLFPVTVTWLSHTTLLPFTLWFLIFCSIFYTGIC